MELFKLKFWQLKTVSTAHDVMCTTNSFDHSQDTSYFTNTCKAHESRNYASSTRLIDVKEKRPPPPPCVYNITGNRGTFKDAIMNAGSHAILTTHQMYGIMLPQRRLSLSEGVKALLSSEIAVNDVASMPSVTLQPSLCQLA